MPQALADGVAIAYDDLRTGGAEDQPPLVLLTACWLVRQFAEDTAAVAASA